MYDDHSTLITERLHGIGWRDGCYLPPYPGLFEQGVLCTSSNHWDHDGDTCPIHEGIEVGAAYALARRQANGMRERAFARAFPIYTAYTRERAAAGAPTGAASGELSYGCPIEWAPNRPEYASEYSRHLSTVAMVHPAATE